MWSQRKSFNLWCWRRSFDREAHWYSDMYGVTSVPHAELSVTADPQATVNSASTKPTVEYSVVDSGTDNNMFGVTSFVELGDTHIVKKIYKGRISNTQGFSTTRIILH